MAWQKGPMPKGTYGWGGVVRDGESTQGFWFADFCGDKVKCIGPDGVEKVISGYDVAWYDNSITLPPKDGE